MSDEKRKRSAAKGRFTRSVNSLENCIKDSDADSYDAQKHFDDLENAWRNVEAKHDEYLSTLDDEANFEREESWISDIQSKYHDVRKRYV